MSVKDTLVGLTSKSVVIAGKEIPVWALGVAGAVLIGAVVFVNSR